MACTCGCTCDMQQLTLGGTTEGNLQLAIVSADDEAAAAQQVAKEKNYGQTFARSGCGLDEEWRVQGAEKCPFKHSLDDMKECNMYKLGFCIYGPNCRPIWR
ncbi:hypothetical protein OEZ86_008071 [Tetradesmus obliquus]|nr:hypothetical protein OEZ86_008071 [Tetradesmus obliquus]